MKINHLWVSNYKNIADIKLDFTAEPISLLVGQNGLGKSNLLEILALIFQDLNLINDQETLEYWAYEETHFEYSIVFECKGFLINIDCRRGSFLVKTGQPSAKSDLAIIATASFIKDKKSMYLPDFIIGYYSGENKRVQQILSKYEKTVIDEVLNNKGLDQGFRSIFFSQSFHSQMILLSLLLFKDDKNDDFSKVVTDFVNEFLSFSELEEFSIKLKNPDWYHKSNRSHRKYSVDSLEDNFLRKDVEVFPFWNAKGKADKILTFLYVNRATDPIYYSDKNETGRTFEILELNSIRKSDFVQDIKSVFSNPLTFLDAFETLYLTKIVTTIKLQVKSKSNNVIFDFNHLSEGEQQLITIMGLLLIMNESECLFLFDEPDTHLNPKWQREYVNLLRRFNHKGGQSHIIMATHSPLIVQAGESIDIFLYKKNQNGLVEIVNNKDLKIHNWRIDQVLASEFFGFDSTRPTSLDGYMSLREKVLSEGELSDDTLAKLRDLENEFGVLPTGETLDEIKTLAMMKTVIKRIS